jgi:hypothetical protein
MRACFGPKLRTEASVQPSERSTSVRTSVRGPKQVRRAPSRTSVRTEVRRQPGPKPNSVRRFRGRKLRSKNTGAELRARTRCGLTKRGTRTATGYSSLDARAAALSALGTPACELQHVQRFSLPAASHSQHGASSLCGCMLWRLRSLLVAAARPKDRAVRARSLAHDERVLR